MTEGVTIADYTSYDALRSCSIGDMVRFNALSTRRGVHLTRAEVFGLVVYKLPLMPTGFETVWTCENGNWQQSKITILTIEKVGPSMVRDFYWSDIEGFQTISKLSDAAG